jgi:hypothetical protein
MQAPNSVDRYFTAQVVGGRLVVDMGRTASARNLPQHGVLVDWVSGLVKVSDMAWRSHWAADPVDPLTGQPLNLPRLSRWRRRVLVVGLAVWSLALGGGMWWWRG